MACFLEKSDIICFHFKYIIMKRLCKICKSEFTVSQSNRKYCSKACAKIAVQRFYKKPPLIGTCAHCGKEIQIYGNQKYCSKKCLTHEHQTQKQIHKRKCLVCGKDFVNSHNQKYCSKKCFKIFYKQYHSKYYESRYGLSKTKICPICKKTFTSDMFNKKYCSKECSNKYSLLSYQKTKNNPVYKLRRNLRTRFYHALKNNSKHSSVTKLVGCSIENLWQYLESQFQPGMTRENYGLWHIDHIKPCASFDFSDPEQQKQCFHYTNLQPLWAKDNLKKSNKY